MHSNDTISRNETMPAHKLFNCNIWLKNNTKCSIFSFFWFIKQLVLNNKQVGKVFFYRKKKLQLKCNLITERKTKSDRE